MVKQLDLLGTGQIIPTSLHVEMERSYLEYAMSVIVGRALPDVRDGLKPVHRRILYAMYELGLTPDRPYRKCARVVGDVLGKYHPHGDQAVYDALVRMVQDFSCRYPLLAGHGNFGSIDNDPPAAMRYTETRLAQIAYAAVLNEIGTATVSFTSNFDNSQQEPVVLPAQLPLLLLNGCTGIAVGMATNVPPHNLGEIIDGLIALIDDSQIEDKKLWQLIPGPDFPTGGEIVGTQGIEEVYRTGRGTIPMRGIVKIEQLIIGKRRRQERTAIIITELPYQVNKAAWIEKVAELVNHGRIEGIADLRDESDRSGMRVVVELKQNFAPQAVLEQLYQQTTLQTNFGAIMLALVNNKPCELSLRELLEEFLKFREETLTRQYTHELAEAQQRLHLIEGLLAALNNLDAVIEILRNAADGTTAKATLHEQLDISNDQADSILAMPMRRLTGLERQKLQTEARDLQARIDELGSLLDNRQELMKSLKKELRSLKRKFGDPRRTRIINLKSKTLNSEKESTLTKTRNESSPSTPTENAILEITHQGYIYWRTSQQERKPSSSRKKDEDFIVYSQEIGKQKQLVAILDSGKAYPISIQEFPHLSKQPKTTLMSLLPKNAQQDGKKIVAHFFPQSDKLTEVVLVTEQGRIKRISLNSLSNLSSRGLLLIKLKEKDRLSYAQLSKEGQEIAIASSAGKVLRFSLNEQQLLIQGRNSQGNLVLPLHYNQQLAGFTILSPDANILLISQLGYAKRLPIGTLRLGKCGESGTYALRFPHHNDNLAAMVLAKTEGKVLLVTNSDRRIILSMDAVPFWGKDGAGDRLVDLKPEEKIVSVICTFSDN